MCVDKIYLITLFFSLYFFLDKKVPKSQDSACFAQKTSVRLAKSFKLAAAQLKHERFFTPISLVFWLTRRGRFAGCESFCNNSPIAIHYSLFVLHSSFLVLLRHCRNDVHNMIVHIPPANYNEVINIPFRRW